MKDKANNGPRVSKTLAAAGLAAAAVLILVYYSFSFSGGPNPNAIVLTLFFERLAYILAAAVTAFAAFSAGLALLWFFGARALPPLEEAVSAFALGLGVFSLLTLFLGLAGLLTPAVFGPLVVIVGSLGITKVGGFFAKVSDARRVPFSLAEKSFAAAAAVGALLTLVYAFNPPVYFDALEYHLGAVAQYFRAGRISYITYNVYSNFPSNGEMLYLLSMVLTGSKFAGALLGNVLNSFVAIAAALAAFCLGSWISSRAAGVFAAAALILAGGFFAAATGVYVEPLQVLYTILAVLAAGRFVQQGNRPALVAGAVFSGLAMCVKYPAALFVTAPLALAVLLRPGSAAARLKSFVTFGLIAAAVVAPWLIKNAAFTGNPVYPLLYSVFGGRDWSPLQDARWVFAHSPKGGLAGEQWVRHVCGLLFGNESVTLLAFAFVPLAFAKRPLPRRVLFTAGYAVLYLFLWFAATHRIDRFALPGLAVLGAVSGAGLFALPQGSARRIAVAVAFFVALTNVYYVSTVYGHALGLDPSVPLFGKYDEFLQKKVGGYEAWDYLNKNVPRGEKVLLVAEAETFYLDVDYASATVFDRKQLDEIVEKAAGDPAAVGRALKDAGFSFIFINWFTFNRQQETYTFQYGGLSVPGYSSVVAPSLFDSLEKAGTIKRKFVSGPVIEPLKVPSYVLYSVE